MGEKRKCVWNLNVFQGDGQQDIRDMISRNFLEILKVNLTEDSYQMIMAATDTRRSESGGTEKLSEWFSRFVKEGCIHEEDLKNYLSFCNPDNMRKQFKTGSKFISCHYRRKLEGEFRWVSMEIVIGQEYSEEKQVAILYVKDIHDDYLQSQFVSMLYRSNFQMIGIIDLGRKTIATMKGELKDISQLLYSEESYEELRQKVCMENIAPIDREAYMAKTTLESLKKNLSEDDYYAFPIYYEKNGEKTIKNYRFRYLSEEFGQVIVTIEDVTSLSEKDALTGGPNQQGFIKKLEKLLRKKKQEGRYAILCLDVKSFKAINELFGILEGNDLLRKLYRDLKESFLEPVITARVEADQYLCLVKWENLDYDRLLSWCEGDYVIKGRPFRVSKRCGIYLIRDNTMPVRSMCDRARLALSIAKSERSMKPYVIFDDAMSEEYIDRSEILGQFDRSLKNREFCVYLQPVVDPVSGQISSAEALVRWNHPQKGFISPQYFVPALEGNGYISQLDLYVVREVEKFQQEREQKGLPVVPISVNLSWMDFYDEELLEWLLRYVASKNSKNHTIRFEITESSYAAVVENRRLLFDRIRKHGAEFLLDDFGSGYSSFSTLQNYDFDILKIDMGFVKRIGQSDKTKSIIDSIIKMVHQMDARVVAEGAETLEQVEFLREQGCDYIQGYYFYKPMSLEKFAEILDSYKYEDEALC